MIGSSIRRKVTLLLLLVPIMLFAQKKESNKKANKQKTEEVTESTKPVSQKLPEKVERQNLADLETKEEKKEHHRADKYFDFEDYAKALEIYLKLDSLHPEDKDLQYRIGLCYMHSEHHEWALPYLQRAEKLGYTTTGKPVLHLDELIYEYESFDLDYNLARSYHYYNKFDLAIEYYNKVIKKYEVAYKGGHDAEIVVIKRYIEMAENGKQLIANPVDVQIENLGIAINTEHEEIVPLVSADESVLIFTSRRPSTTGGGKDQLGRYMEDIYMSKKVNGKWTEAKNMGSPVNSNEHDACVGLSPDGSMLLVYKNNNFNTGDLYFSELEGDSWTKPIKFPDGINTKYLENSASVTVDEKTMYFTSNRPEGSGGSDIYVVKKDEEGKWGQPKNLGDIVNTQYDEDAPFIHPDGKTLYFSSKGHNSMGGYDIFRTTFDPVTATWSTPINLGYPINTAENDIFFVFSADGKRAYFASHREDSYGRDDLYMMTRAEKVSLILMKGFVLSDVDGKGVDATITVIDNENGEKVAEFSSNKSTGKYTVILAPGKNYGVSIEAANCIPVSKNINLPDKGEYYEKEVDFMIHPVISEKSVVTVLKNVFFDYDKAELRKESFPELDKYCDLLKKNPALLVEIAGHTDSDGSADYNLKLSQRRADAVVKYMIAKGIDKSRLYAVGYGKSFPVASNDTEEGKQLNRRTELIIHDEKEGTEWMTKGHYYR